MTIIFDIQIQSFQVRIGDLIILESLKAPGLFLHTSLGLKTYDNGIWLVLRYFCLLESLHCQTNVLVHKIMILVFMSGRDWVRISSPPTHSA